MTKVCIRFNSIAYFLWQINENAYFSFHSTRFVHRSIFQIERNELTHMQKIIGFSRNTRIIWLRRWHCFSLWTRFYRCSTSPSTCVIRTNWRSSSPACWYLDKLSGICVSRCSHTLWNNWSWQSWASSCGARWVPRKKPASQSTAALAETRAAQIPRYI